MIKEDFFMRKFIALIISICLFFSSEMIIYGETNQTENKITYVVIADAELLAGEAVNILVGLDNTENITNLELIVKNTDIQKNFIIKGEITDDGNALFCYNELDSGCYLLDYICYSNNGNEYTVYFSEIGIKAQFGVETIVLDSNPDYYIVDDMEENISEEESEVIISDINSQGEEIEEGISDIVNKSQKDFSVNDIFGTASNPVIVVIDPGHGGKDGGACRSINGKTYTEKELNLSIAKYCKEELETYANVKVYLTRNDDTYVALEDRASYAKSVNANILVAIHNNSSAETKLHGAEIYYPNSNYRPEIGQEGYKLASCIQAQLVSLGLSNNGTKIRNSESGDTYPDGSACDYYKVIRECKKYDIIGIIVEHAYISNSNDASNFLGSNTALKKLGIADATGIAKYFGLCKSVYNGVDYSLVFDAKEYISRYADIKAAFGNDSGAALSHFVNNGMKEGRVGRASFDVRYYKNEYEDLSKAYGNNLQSYYFHFMQAGIKEGRRGSLSYDPYSYLGYNPKLYKTYSKDFLGLYKYYINYGQNAGQKAEYNDSQYRVNFYKYDNNIAENVLISSQTIKFGHSATEPQIIGGEVGETLEWSKPFNVVTSDIDTYASWKYLYEGIDYSLVFNAEYYLNKYADLKKAFGTNGNAALQHFVNCGMREGRQAIDSFDVFSYRARYADLQNAFGNDLKQYYLHYIKNGHRECRDATMDTAEYTVTFYNDGKIISTQTIKYGHDAKAPDVSKNGATFSGWNGSYKIVKANQIVTASWKYMYGGVDYSSVFDADYYLNKYPDLQNAYGNNGSKAFSHFLIFGINEGRQAKASFNVGSYKNRYVDLRNAFGGNTKQYYLHYINYGVRENRIGTGFESTMVGYVTKYNGKDYSAVYDYNYYVSKYSDIKRAFGSDDKAVLQHFINYGMKEGRQGSAEFDVEFYKSKYSDLQNAFGNNKKSYYLHYIDCGKRENRVGVKK